LIYFFIFAINSCEYAIMMKEKYADVEVKTIEFIRGNAVLNAAGSLTQKPIEIDSSVSVDDLQEDGFDDSPFTDLRF